MLKMTRNEFNEKCEEILDFIKEEFEEFLKIHREHRSRDSLVVIDSELFTNDIRKVLKSKSDEELYFLISMARMLSGGNCWWVLYDVGDTVHREAIKIICSREKWN